MRAMLDPTDSVLFDAFKSSVGVRTIFPILLHARDEIAECPVASQLRSGKASPQAWAKWGYEYYYASNMFKPLMESGIEKANEAGLLEVKAALYGNLFREQELRKQNGKPHGQDYAPKLY